MRWFARRCIAQRAMSAAIHGEYFGHRTVVGTVGVIGGRTGAWAQSSAPQAGRGELPGQPSPPAVRGGCKVHHASVFEGAKASGFVCVLTHGAWLIFIVVGPWTAGSVGVCHGRGCRRPQFQMGRPVGISTRGECGIDIAVRNVDTACRGAGPWGLRRPSSMVARVQLPLCRGFDPSPRNCGN